MDRQAILPPQGAAKIAITLTAVGAGSALGIFSATWVSHGLAQALPLLVGGVLLLTLGGFMWKGAPTAYVGSLVTSVGLYGYALLGMAGFFGSAGGPWHVAALGALSVLTVAIVVFTAVYLRDQATAGAASSRLAPLADASSTAEAQTSSDTN